MLESSSSAQCANLDRDINSPCRRTISRQVREEVGGGCVDWLHRGPCSAGVRQRSTARLLPKHLVMTSDARFNSVAQLAHFLFLLPVRFP